MTLHVLLIQQAMKAQRVNKIWLYSFFNLATRCVGWSTIRPGRFTRGKEMRYPLYERVGGRKDRSGRVQKISPTPGIHPRTVPPAANRCTDYATSAHPTYWCQISSTTRPFTSNNRITRSRFDVLPGFQYACHL